MGGPWTTSEYERLFKEHPPSEPHAPSGAALDGLAAEFGRSRGAVSAQWNDARSAVLNSQTAASAQLLGYLRRQGWLGRSYRVSRVEPQAVETKL